MVKRFEFEHVADLQPDELTELKKLVSEYISRRGNLESEISLLNEDLKALDEEFSDRLDVKTLKAVLQIMKKESSLVRKDTADLFREILSEQ